MIFFFGFQESATPYMEGIINFHNDVLFYLFLILFFVLNIFVAVVFNFGYRVEFPQQVEDLKFRNFIMIGNKIQHGQTLEIVWTLIPCVILYLIATPSLALLYSMDEVIAPTMTFKAIGHQWYWSYEFSDLNSHVAFDSYMLATEDLEKGQYRNLDVDNELVLPVNTHIRAIITSTDVLHSWSVNSLGIKVDAVPGRLNQASIYIKREGVFYGQCSEICGVQHGFMPIVVKAVSLDTFVSYFKTLS